jgi:hypothetical protein
MYAMTSRQKVLVTVEGETAPFLIAPPEKVDHLRRLLEARGLAEPGNFRSADGSALIDLVAGADANRVRELIDGEG